MAKLQLRLKSHFIEEPLAEVQHLAAEIYHNIDDEQTIEQLFKYKTQIFVGPFN